MKKRVLSMLLIISILTVLFNPSSTALASTNVFMGDYIEVKSCTVNETTSTVTLKYIILKTLPSNLMNITMDYSYGIPQISGGGVTLKRTKGTYTQTLKIKDYHCSIHVGLTMTAYSYSETQFLITYHTNTTPTVTYHTVTAAEAALCYIAMSAGGVALEITPETKAIKVISKIALWAGLGAGFAEVTGFWDGIWQPTKGNYMKITTYFKDNQFIEESVIWTNKECYTKNVSPINSGTITYNIP